MKVNSIISNEIKNAGLKAPYDIDIILNNKYEAKIINYVRKDYYKFKMLKDSIKDIFSKEIIIIQYPYIFKKNIYKILVKKKSIILLHDINGLRNNDKKMILNDIEIFNLFNYIIVHNNKMKDFLIKNGIVENKIYVLECFDYLCNDINNINNNPQDFSICYAGNLKKEKCPFVYQIDNNKINFKINLYGIGIEKDLYNNVKYKGSFEPDNLPNNLEGKLGLVWDGNYDESDENDGFKNYTKYNNSHKLSCYIAAGIPVVVWKKAAIADFVKKYNIGYTISNIYDINTLDFSDYDKKLNNVRELKEKVRVGYFTKRVIDEILTDMGEIENETK